MLKLQFKDKSREPIWIVENNYTIGTAASANLRLDDPELSPQHAQLITQDRKLMFRVLVSQPPCTLNGQLVDEAEVKPGDTLAIGDTELLILHPHESISQPALSEERLPQWSLVATSSWMTGKEFKVGPGKVLVGRGSQCELVIPGTHLSRQHAEVEVRGNQLLVRDLGSANGTFINNQRITEALANQGDEVRFDIYPFKIKGPNTDYNKTRVRPRTATVIAEANKTAPSENRQWLTKPTSPGNREEPQERHNRLLPLVSAALCLLMLAAVVYLGLL
ncbi:MAG: FHA domain-containing protein [Pseudomonadota bacterium]|nr:FHA domain-containing protein [Pseudomonadota bacterium]